MKYNLRIMSEIEVVNKTCRTADAFINGIEAIVKRHKAGEKIIKEYSNGLVTVAILDKNGLLIGEYTRAKTIGGEKCIMQS